MKKRDSFRPERHWQQTQVQLIIAGLLVLGLVGGGLVWLIYGRSAALTAVTCLLAFAGVMGFLWLILSLLERWARDDDFRDDDT